MFVGGSHGDCKWGLSGLRVGVLNGTEKTVVAMIGGNFENSRGGHAGPDITGRAAWAIPVTFSYVNASTLTVPTVARHGHGAVHEPTRASVAPLVSDLNSN